MEITSTYNDSAKLLEEKRQKMSRDLATMLHENWRKQRYDEETKSYTSRIKTTTDKKWIQEHNGATDVDIANTNFEELPSDWQEENLLSAKVAIEKIEDVLYLIHDNWLDRNDYRAMEEQKTQYSKLSNDEKLKDIDVLEDAIQIMRKDTI
jgi:primosomal protein N'